jgi:Golgi apparatus protein 1
MLLARTFRQVTSEECQKEIFYFEKMEADDYRNDPLLAEACRPDVEEFCNDVEPGAALG